MELSPTSFDKAPDDGEDREAVEGKDTNGLKKVKDKSIEGKSTPSIESPASSRSRQPGSVDSEQGQRSNSKATKSAKKSAAKPLSLMESLYLSRASTKKCMKVQSMYHIANSQITYFFSFSRDSSTVK